MKFLFERSRRVYNRVLKPEPSILEFSFFFFFFSFHFLSPRSLLSLPFLPPAKSPPARPSAVRCPSGPSTLRRTSPGLAQPRSARGGEARSRDQSAHQPRPTRTRRARSPGRRAPGHADWTPAGHGSPLPARASFRASFSVQEPAPCRASAGHPRHHVG